MKARFWIGLTAALVAAGCNDGGTDDLSSDKVDTSVDLSVEPPAVDTAKPEPLEGLDDTGGLWDTSEEPEDTDTDTDTDTAADTMDTSTMDTMDTSTMDTMDTSTMDTMDTDMPPVDTADTGDTSMDTDTMPIDTIDTFVPAP